GRTKKGEGRSPPLLGIRPRRLEVELQGQLDDPVTTLQDDLAEVLQGVRGQAEALRRVAHVVREASGSVRNVVDVDVAGSVQVKVDVLEAPVVGRSRLVEEVERADPELQLLVPLADLEVLEERHVEVDAAGDLDVVGGRDGTGLTEGRDPDAVDVEDLLP